MFAEGFILGLATGTYCMAACFPVALPFLLGEELPGPGRNAALVGYFLLGRLAAYLLFGLALGALGSWTAAAFANRLPPSLAAWAYAALGLLMIVSGATSLRPGPRFCRGYRRIMRPGGSALAYGLLTGINVCPPFLTAAARVFGKTGSLGGALYFLAFFAGTAVYFLPLLGVVFVQRHLDSIKQVARVATVILGGYFFMVLGVFRI